MTPVDVNVIAELDEQYSQFMNAGAGLQRVVLRRLQELNDEKIEVKVIGTGRILLVDASTLLDDTQRIRSEWSRRISKVIKNSAGFGTIELVVSKTQKRVRAFWTVSLTEQEYTERRQLRA